MTNIFIYSGFGLLLLAALIGLVAAIKGYVLTKNIPFTDLTTRQKVKESLKTYTTPALILMITGFIVVGIGLWSGLK